MNKFIYLTIVAILLALVGCGFSPVYQKESSTKKFLEQIYFSEPAGEADFLFLNSIEGKIQNRSTLKYLVSYSIIVSDSETLERRGSLHGRVNFTVINIPDSTTIFNGSVSNFVGYTSLGGLGGVVASTSSRNDALARLMSLLADSVHTRLIILGNNIE